MRRSLRVVLTALATMVATALATACDRDGAADGRARAPVSPRENYADAPLRTCASRTEHGRPQPGPGDGDVRAGPGYFLGARGLADQVVGRHDEQHRIGAAARRLERRHRERRRGIASFRLDYISTGVRNDLAADLDHAGIRDFQPRNKP